MELQSPLSQFMMTSSNGNSFCVTGPLCGEFIGHRWIPHTKASDAELWCFLWSTPEKNGWANNRKAGHLRRHRTHHDVIVMSFCRRQAIALTNADILSITSGTKFSEFSIKIQQFCINKLYLELSFAKCQPFCSGLNDGHCPDRGFVTRGKGRCGLSG